MTEPESVCAVCGARGAPMCSAPSMFAHMCVSCLRTAVARSAALDASIFAFRSTFRLPSFVINELAGKELNKHAPPDPPAPPAQGP